MWGCALGPLEASALMATSPRKEERKKDLPDQTLTTGGGDPLPHSPSTVISVVHGVKRPWCGDTNCDAVECPVLNRLR